MRKLTSLFFLLFCWASAARATECVDAYIDMPHLHLYLCQNGTGYTESLTCLYKGRAKALDDYIGTLIARGQLENKIVSVEIFDQVLTFNHLELNWNDTSYTIAVSGYPDLERLAGYVEYFTKSGKQPITFDYEKYHQHPDSASAGIDRFNRSLATPRLKIVKDTTWRQDEACLIYENDEQHYFLAGRKLAVKADGNLPVKAGDCWLFLQHDEAFAFRNGKQLTSFIIPPDYAYEGDFGVTLRNNNVDFCFGGCPDDENNPDENVVFRFVYSKHAFHGVAKAQH